MQSPPIPHDELDRLAELDKLELMYTEPEAVFDRVTAQLAEVFDAPAVMMSLIDRDKQYVKSSAGIPDQMLGDRTIPRQYTICGHVVGTNQSLVVPDMLEDERFRDNPFVKEKGVRFYAGAPLHSDSGQPVGALCVLDFKPRDISAREQKLLTLMADSLMTEVRLRKMSRQLLDRTRAMERDLVSARAVQRFLLPQQKQEGRGYTLWYHYHPFDAIGGDFLDARIRPDGSLATLLADVSGHGPSAALTSAMVKSIFQQAALQATMPGQLLDAVNRDLMTATSMENSQFITASAAVFETGGRSVRLASAGHPFPILLRGGKSQVVDTVNDLPLLIEQHQVYGRQTTLKLLSKDRLLFYTDGASEASDPSGAMLDVGGLMTMIEANAQFAGGEFLSSLFAAVRSYAVGQLRDDVALVCLEVK